MKLKLFKKYFFTTFIIIAVSLSAMLMILSVVLNSHILRKFQRGEVRRVLFMATGALLSTTSSQQGESIPGIAHAIVLEVDG